MKKTIFFLLIIILSGCNNQIRFLKGNYYHEYNIFGGETITFEDSTHFHYMSITDDVSSKRVRKGTYIIFNDTLQLNFDNRNYSNPYNFIKMDNTISNDSLINLDIQFNISYTLKAIPFGIVSIINLKNDLVISDTADSNGHLLIKLNKSNDKLVLKTSYIQNSKSNDFLTNSLQFKSNKNYMLTVFSTTQDRATDFEVETINYQIEFINNHSFKIKNDFDNKRYKTFVRIEKK